MAYLGVITSPDVPQFAFRQLPVWRYYGTPIELFDYDITGVIDGVVRNAGISIQYARVALFWRRNGELIALARTDASGYFRFNGLETGVGEYVVSVLHDDPAYNAQVLDRVIPR